jgi:predicted DNA-binding transcriptional regulator AlpA
MSKETKKDKYKPTQAAKKLLEVLLNPECRFLNKTEVCKKARIRRSTYYVLFNNPRFVQYYKTKAKDLVAQAVGPVIGAFVKEAKAGSFQHGKVILEMMDLHVDVKKHQLTGKDDGPIVTKRTGMSQEEIEKEMKERGIPIPE